MPTALMCTLRPTAAASVPASMGRLTYSAILRLIAAADGALAQQLHDDDRVKPLTVSNVLGLDTRGPEVAITPAHDYGLRVTLLTAALERVATEWTPQTVPALDLNGTIWQVERVSARSDEHPWAGAVSYEGLAAPALLRAANGPTRWMLEFASPVTFRQRGLNQPLPTPDLVFGSLLDKWNAFAPLALPDEVRRFAAECIAVNRFDLHSAAEPTKNGALQIGAIGRCTYTATNRDRYWLACIETLARFAFYSGVGAGTSRGFGRARLVSGGEQADGGHA